MPDQLSDRQRECLLLAQRMTDKEMARHLHISERTVNKHVTEAMRRLGVHSRRAAIRLLEEFPPEALTPMAPSPPTGLHEPVEASDFWSPQDELIRAKAGWNERLGSMRTPPRSWRFRIYSILALMVLTIMVLVVVTAVGVMVFEATEKFAAARLKGSTEMNDLNPHHFASTVAIDFRESERSIDSACIRLADTISAALTGRQVAGLAAAAGQDALHASALGLCSLTEARGHLVRAHRFAERDARRMNLDYTLLIPTESKPEPERPPSKGQLHQTT